MCIPFIIGMLILGIRHKPDVNMNPLSVCVCQSFINTNYAVACYKVIKRGSKSGAMLDIVDCCSMLWRLELEGVYMFVAYFHTVQYSSVVFNSR